MQYYVILLDLFRPRQNGRHFANDIFKRILLYDKLCIMIPDWLKFAGKGWLEKKNTIKNISSAKGEVLSRRQAIIWINDELVY